MRLWHNSNSHRHEIGLFGASLIFLTIGAYTLATARTIVPFAVAEIEAGRGAPARWLNLKGRLLLDHKMQIKFHKLEFLVPLVSEQWRPGDRVQVLWKGETLPPVTQREFPGMLSRTRIYGWAPTEFDEFGLSPDSRYFILESAQSDTEDLQQARAVLGGSGFLFLIGSLVWLFKEWRAARTGW